MSQPIRPAPRPTLTGVTTSGVGIPALGVIAMTLVLLLAPGYLPAQDIQPLDSIRDVARDHVVETMLPAGQRNDVTIGRLDPRLRLRRCDAPLEAFRNHSGRQGARSTIGVRCTGSTPWTIYVSARIDSYMDVYVLNRSLARGERIQESDLDLVETNVGNLAHGYITDPTRAVGMEVRRAARGGEVLTPALLAPPELVRRGETVTVLASTGAAEITMQGEALDSGAKGDRIRVRNARSQRVVEGEIIGSNRVRIPM